MNAEGLLAHYTRIADAPDAITRLRRFVLDLAVRGKLVAQDQKEEPAAVLLSKIATAKLQWERSRKTRHRLAPSEVKEADIPFLTPTTWGWVRFGQIADFSAGRTPSRNDLSFWERGDHAWVSIRDMEDGQVLTATKEAVSNKARDKIFGSEPEPPGTMLMSFKLTIGKICRLGISAFHNEAIISIRPYLADLDPYLFEILPQFASEGNSKDAIKGATLNRHSIANILLPLPPLAEQNRIIAKLNELMALCDQLEAARAQREATRDRLAAASLARLNTPDPDTFPADVRFALDALPALTTRPDQIKPLRQTILNLAVRGKLVAQHPDREQVQQELLRSAKRKSDDGDESRRHTVGRATPYKLPVNWIWATTEEICTAIVDCPHSTPVFSSQGIPCLDTNSVKSGSVVHSKLRFVSEEVYRDRIRRLTPESGDVIFAREGSVGESTVVPEGMRCCMGQRVMLFRPSDLVAPKYFQLALSEPSSLERLLERHKGIGARHVNVSDMRQALLPVPPLAEQRRIVAKVDELMALCDQLEASLTTSETTRIRLLDALLHETLAPAPTVKVKHQRAAVSGYVVSRLASRRNFGRTAHMKHLYLAESRLGLKLGGRYMREAAGPLDTDIYELEKQAEAAGWYTYNVEKLPSGKEKVSYVPGKALKALAEEGVAVLGPLRKEMDRLIDLMGGLKTEQVEIIATLFAAWNDALLDSHTPDDNWIVKEVREHWHASKQRFAPDDLRTWLGWMRQNDVVPLGHPPRTMQQTTMEF